MSSFVIRTKETKRTITTIPFDENQKQKVRMHKGRKLFNKQGAMEEAKIATQRWIASDQFQDTSLEIAEI